MVPQTYPSILNPYTNRHEMVVKQLASTSGLQRWTDYIPVKLSASTRPAGEQTTDGDGFIAINTSQNTSTGVAFKDWVPVYFDNDATDAWVVSASGYIPIGASGGAIAILKSFGSNAHVYLPGANGVAIGGLNSGNYVESTFSTLASVDSVVGGVRDPVGSIDATQATTANKPAVRRGLLNQALWSNDITNAVWQVVNTASKTGQTVNLPASSDAVTEYVASSTLSAVGSQVTFGVYLSGSGTTKIYIRSSGGVYEDFFSPTITLTDTPTLYTVSAAFANASHTGLGFGVFRNSGALTATAVTLAGAGLFAGTLTAAQILSEGGIPLTTSAAASNQSAGRYSWQFDGTNDSLALGSVLLQQSDDCCIIASGSYDGGSGGYLFSTGGASPFPAVGDIGFDNLSKPRAAWKDDSGTSASIVHSVAITGTPVVIASRKIGLNKQLFVNGVQSGSTVTTALGTSTLTASSIGKYGAGGSLHNGSIGPVIVIKGTISDSDLLTLERWVASQTPNGPVF